jgi:putative transposase
LAEKADPFAKPKALLQLRLQEINKEPQMPGPKPPEVPLTETELEELKALIRAHKTRQHIALRARIILLLATGLDARAVARRLDISRTTVRLWRRHWFERLEATVIERLQDDPRPGTPQTFTAEQWCQIMALACESPELSERPISHWTPRELADEAIKRGIVKQISVRHVGRFLKSGRIEATSKSLLAQPRTRPSSGDQDR